MHLRGFIEEDYFDNLYYVIWKNFQFVNYQKQHAEQ